MKFKTILAVLIALIIVIFSLQNAEVTDIKFFFWQLSASRVIIILGSFGIGVLVGILASAKRRFVNTKKF
jgi:putative membrane protein